MTLPSPALLTVLNARTSYIFDHYSLLKHLLHRSQSYTHVLVRVYIEIYNYNHVNESIERIAVELGVALGKEHDTWNARFCTKSTQSEFTYK